MEKSIIKKCINPHCDEIAHNIEKKETRCRNCGFMLVEINYKQYQKKFFFSPFQIDYSTGNIFNHQTTINL